MKKQSMIIDISNVKTDNRGYLYNAPEQLYEFIDKIVEIHLADLNTNGIRGNHYNSDKKEALIVNYTDSWVYAWSFKNEEKHIQNFSGKGHVLIFINKNISHSIKNTGNEPLNLVSFSDTKFSSANPDTTQIKLLD